mmetsp:Transcript_26104/g.69476  ORF Transcript_26104/g.69476 Transcript_26104/m.69476 type:complete len:217 (-) Transcript_26104:1269-1919(-)
MPRLPSRRRCSYRASPRSHRPRCSTTCSGCSSTASTMSATSSSSARPARTARRAIHPRRLPGPAARSCRWKRRWTKSTSTPPTRTMTRKTAAGRRVLALAAASRGTRPSRRATISRRGPCSTAPWSRRRACRSSSRRNGARSTRTPPTSRARAHGTRRSPTATRPGWRCRRGSIGSSPRTRRPRLPFGARRIRRRPRRPSPRWRGTSRRNTRTRRA